MAKDTKKGLGTGLSALFGEDFLSDGDDAELLYVPLSKVEPRADQPRSSFDDAALSELADSIAQYGLIQPITVRKLDSGYYQIIAGERRWRASQRAGLTHIPAYIRTVDDENMMEMALVENIQRQDLSAMEISLAYQHLIEQYGLTQEQLSEKVGKNRATVTNYLRLLKLPAPVQVALRNKEIDMGHARALLALNDPAAQLQVFGEMRNGKLSVRKIEEMVKELSEGGSVKTKDGKRIRQKGSNLSSDYSELRNMLSRIFQTKVQLTCADTGKGKITIPFSDNEELERIMSIIDQRQS